MSPHSPRSKCGDSDSRRGKPLAMEHGKGKLEKRCAREQALRARRPKEDKVLSASPRSPSSRASALRRPESGRDVGTSPKSRSRPAAKSRGTAPASAGDGKRPAPGVSRQTRKRCRGNGDEDEEEDEEEDGEDEEEDEDEDDKEEDVKELEEGAGEDEDEDEEGDAEEGGEGSEQEIGEHLSLRVYKRRVLPGVVKVARTRSLLVERAASSPQRDRGRDGEGATRLANTRARAARVQGDGGGSTRGDKSEEGKGGEAAGFRV
jgi:hypothetical protein